MVLEETQSPVEALLESDELVGLDDGLLEGAGVTEGATLVDKSELVAAAPQPFKTNDNERIKSVLICLL